MIKVKANFPESSKFGWFGDKRRYHGDEFQIEEPKQFSEEWMICLEPEKLKPKKEPLKKA